MKSQTNQPELDDYLARFTSDRSCDRFFFIYHSANHELALPNAEPHHHVWSGRKVTAAAIDSGLVNWSAERA